MAALADPPPAPESNYYTIGNVIISGNVKTRTSIIERELPFLPGDHYTPEELVGKMETARRQLMNTTLFHQARVLADEYQGTSVNIRVEVQERSYLFPMPYFKPVDRNINQWLVEQKGSLNRVNYGAKLTYNNATGRNDKLRLWLIGGYTRQVSFSYDRLYIDKKLRWGAGVSFAWGKNREINYNTVNDKQVFLKDPGNYLRRFVNGIFSLSYRPAINTRHTFGIAFTSEEVEDTIVALNPSYFKPGRNRTGYPSIFYTMNWFNLDYIPYPTRGYGAQVSISKNGLNHAINLWQLHVKGLANWPLSKNTFLHLNLYGGIKLPFEQPYFNRRFFGYGDLYLQGYEYNVIDGVAGGFVKTTLSRELTRFRVRVPQGRKKDPLSVPFRIFGKVYGNTGYVYNPVQGENALSNKMLYTGGLGLDIVTLYDVCIRLEWSFNQLGQNDLFLHRKNIF
ncbi:MAG: POTRA domain-containing protein [Chitinophagaceae bacterium]